jgi:hypothetical protein
VKKAYTPAKLILLGKLSDLTARISYGTSA